MWRKPLLSAGRPQTWWDAAREHRSGCLQEHTAEHRRHSAKHLTPLKQSHFKSYTWNRPACSRASFSCWGFPIDSPFSLCWSLRVKVHTCGVGKGHSFKLLLSSVCQSWGWAEPFRAVVGQGGACAAPTWLLRTMSRVHAAGEGSVRQGDPGEQGAGGKLTSHRAKPGKGSFYLVLFLLLQHRSRASWGLSPTISLHCFVPHLLCRNYDVGRLYSHNKYHVPCDPIKLFSL